MISTPHISVVIPCSNEAQNLPELYRRLAQAFPPENGSQVEFVIVNDGSADDSGRVLEDLHNKDSRVVPVHLKHRSGQTGALWAGLEVSRGNWVAHLDGDLQNDPADLPPMLQTAQNNHLDAVLGYRDRRHDNWGRRVSSRVANVVRRIVLGDKIRDIGCSTRVVKREVLAELVPVPNLHRFLPALIELGGWSFVQKPTHHEDRIHGTSKYNNLGRGLQSLRDLPRMVRYVSTLRKRRSKENQK